MIVSIFGSSKLIEGSLEDIMMSIIESECSVADGIVSYLLNLAMFYEEITVPSVEDVKKDLSGFMRYAFYVSVQVGHLEIHEGGRLK